MNDQPSEVYAIAPLNLRGSRVLYAATIELPSISIKAGKIRLPGGLLPHGTDPVSGLRLLAAERGWALTMQRYLFHHVHTAEINGRTVHFYQVPFALPLNNYTLKKQYDIAGLPLTYLADAECGADFLATTLLT